jgi:hypothetical protein
LWLELTNNTDAIDIFYTPGYLRVVPTKTNIQGIVLDLTRIASVRRDVLIILTKAVLRNELKHNLCTKSQ